MAPHKVARPIWPNAGTAARYRRALLKEIAEMVRDVQALLFAQRKSDPPVLAEDATTPSVEINKQFDAIADRWKERFGSTAEKLAEDFLRHAFRGTDSAMRQALRASGWTVEFTMTPAMRDAFEASLAENVGLIRSIPDQYLQQVQGIVMRSYAAGRDLQTMTREIKELYPKVNDRAVLIARDQSNKASAVVQRARQKELGITEAIWQHSHAGREPRPTHVAMNGKRYKIAEGMYDSAVKQHILPGELVNCRCTSRSVLPWTPANN